MGQEICSNNGKGDICYLEYPIELTPKTKVKSEKLLTIHWDLGVVWAIEVE